MDSVMRKEKDALGEVLVPDQAYYGAQTRRALENFRIGQEIFPPEFICAYALIKKTAARVHAASGALEPSLARAIEQAADEVIAGKFDNQFPLVIWQSGSGTQFNMNVNEVLANRANEILGAPRGAQSPVHPNDHVNRSQSTNDTFPASMHIASVELIQARLLPALDGLRAALAHSAEKFHEIIKIARTHLQDAVPIRLGQEFSAYAAQLDRARRAVVDSLDGLYELPLGGTAVGTGLNTAVGFDEKIVAQISQLTGFPFRVMPNKFAGLASHEPVLIASGALKTLAAALIKIANDIRWMGSGPRCGLGELSLPAQEPGSSIMPGKINPTQCEMLIMVACQVFGNDAAMAMAGAMGNFELNVCKPLLACNLLQSLRLLADACNSFTEKCIRGLVPNQTQMEEYVRRSLMLGTALNEHLGYDRAAQAALKAWRENLSLKEAAVALGFLTPQQFDQWVQPLSMLEPHKP